MSAHPHIRVGTWNLWWRFGAWDRRGRTIARVLALVDADVLGLQEVWSTERENQAEALAARLGMHFVWAPSPRPERWQERIGDRSVAVGTAILSRWPLAEHDVRALEGAAMPALHAVVDTPAGGLPVFAVHLDSALGASSLRCRQVAALAAFVGGKARGTFLRSSPATSTPSPTQTKYGFSRATRPRRRSQVRCSSTLGASQTLALRKRPGTAATPMPPPRGSRTRASITCSSKCRPRGGRVLGARRFGTAPIDGVWPSDHFGVLAHIAAVGTA